MGTTQIFTENKSTTDPKILDTVIKGIKGIII